MKCPSEETWLQSELAELTLAEQQTMEQHALGCSQCAVVRAEQRRLLADLRALPNLPSSDEEFVARVLTAATRLAPERQSQLTRARRSMPRLLVRLAIGATGLAAVAASVLLVRTSSESGEFWTRRGAVPLEAPAPTSVQVFVLRGKLLDPLQGAVLVPGDRLAVSYSNALDEARYLSVFAVDAARSVHWIFPAYPDAASNPESILLDPRVEQRMLDEVVEPEAPADGPLRVFALVTRTPLAARHIEAQLSATHGQLPTSLPTIAIQEWSCVWRAR